MSHPQSSLVYCSLDSPLAATTGNKMIMKKEKKKDCDTKSICMNMYIYLYVFVYVGQPLNGKTSIVSIIALHPLIVRLGNTSLPSSDFCLLFIFSFFLFYFTLWFSLFSKESTTRPYPG